MGEVAQLFWGPLTLKLHETKIIYIFIINKIVLRDVIHLTICMCINFYLLVDLWPPQLFPSSSIPHSLTGSMSFLWPLYMRTLSRDNGMCYNPEHSLIPDLITRGKNVCLNYCLKDHTDKRIRYLWGTYSSIVSERVWGNPRSQDKFYSVLAGMY